MFHKNPAGEFFQIFTQYGSLVKLSPVRFIDDLYTWICFCDLFFSSVFVKMPVSSVNRFVFGIHILSTDFSCGNEFYTLWGSILYIYLCQNVTSMSNYSNPKKVDFFKKSHFFRFSSCVTFYMHYCHQMRL